jgi:hypothetical protein
VLISGIRLQSGPNFYASRCHQALILGIAPPSGTNFKHLLLGTYFKHCAAVQHSFSALRHCRVLLLGIAPLPGVYQSSLPHSRNLSIALVSSLVTETHVHGKCLLLLLEIWLSPMPSFVGVQPTSTSLPELYQVEPNLH